MPTDAFFALLRKEFLMEFRQKYALGGIVLYVVSMVFVVYSAAMNIQPQVWNVLFWIILLFASINAAVKGFVQESGARQLYYYQVLPPTVLIFGKIAYNVVLLMVLGLLAYGAFSVVGGHPVRDLPLFFLTLGLGSVSFAISLTFISAIAAKANNSATLMAILSFPIILPVLMLLIRLSAIALRLIQDTAWKKDLYSLLAIDGILLALVFILFPFLWKD